MVKKYNKDNIDGVKFTVQHTNHEIVYSISIDADDKDKVAIDWIYNDREESTYSFRYVVADNLNKGIWRPVVQEDIW